MFVCSDFYAVPGDVLGSLLKSSVFFFHQAEVAEAVEEVVNTGVEVVVDIEAIVVVEETTLPIVYREGGVEEGVMVVAVEINQTVDTITAVTITEVVAAGEEAAGVVGGVEGGDEGDINLLILFSSVATNPVT